MKSLPGVVLKQLLHCKKSRGGRPPEGA